MAVIALSDVLYLALVALAIATLLTPTLAETEYAISYRTDNDTCVSVDLNECFTCVEDDYERHLMCSERDGRISCLRYDDASCKYTDDDDWETEQTPCANLSYACQVSVLATSALILTVDASEEDLSVEVRNPGYYSRGISPVWAQGIDRATAGGSLTDLAFISGSSTLQVLASHDNDTITTNAGSCQLGTWCEAAGGLSYQASYGPVPSIDVGDFVMHFNFNSTIRITPTEDEAAKAMFTFSRGLIFAPESLPGISIDVLADVPYTLSDLVLENEFSTTPVVSYTVSSEGEDNEGFVICEAYPHGYDSPLFMGATQITCNFPVVLY